MVARMIGARLKTRIKDESSDHLDEDVIAVFIEGRAGEAHSQALVSHLVRCTSCLHLTAELIRGLPELDEVSSATMPDESDGPLKRMLDRITQHLVPSAGEEAVFAYQEPADINDGESEGTTAEDEK